MRDLWDAISEQPALLIFLVLALLSWVGNLAGGAAKKAQQEAQRRAQAQRAQQRPGAAPAVTPRDPRGQQPQLRPQATTSSAPTAEEIAAEIRRVMGFETGPVIMQPPPPPPAPRVVVVDHEPWAAERRPVAPAVTPRPVAPAIRGRPVRGRPRRRRGLDLSDPAAAIVLMEVLGKPRALRDLDERV